MFKTMVVALDLEADGDRVLPVVAALSRQGHIAVDLVTVSAPGMPTATDAYELERRARDYGWDRDSWTVIQDIDVADGLLQHAARLDEALIVMATDAHAPWSSTVFGSVPHDVLRRTNRPVLLVGPRVPWWSRLETTTLLACVDGDDAQRVVDPIVSWQHTFDAQAPMLAEVVNDVGPATPAEHQLVELVELLAAQGVHADLEVLIGDDPVTRLEEHADRLLGAVYVATSARYTDGRLHWHSTTRQLVRRSSHPVLVVPARPMPLPLRAEPAFEEHRVFENTVIPAALTTPAGGV